MHVVRRLLDKENKSGAMEWPTASTDYPAMIACRVHGGNAVLPIGFR